MADVVDLVRAYLHVNGYFTVSEYPLLEELRDGGHRTFTDLDVLAFRFPGAGPVSVTPARGLPLVPVLLEPDPVLGLTRGEADMVVAEVKEGRAELNRGARDPRVLEAALVRFGCCHPEEVRGLVDELLASGSARAAAGHRIRLLAFGSSVPESGPRGYRAITLGHVATFLREHMRSHWDVLRHAQVLDPALGFLALLEKAERGEG